ncbi:hypothetical protein BGX33_009011 [Mortierella sp. NVP41]|nr:hypothetical protein BGX33_009011 [Mortierella sp. NVP41]
MDLEILTRPPTLIPRWETEEWTARLATALKSNPLIFRQQQETSPRNPTLTNTNTTGPVFSILDICTGSGCIPLGLASALPPGSSRIFGTDIHPKAVQLARDNAAHNAALLNQNCVRFFQADLLAPNAVEEFLGWLDDVDDVDDGGPNSQAMYPSGTRHEAGMEDNARSREQQWRRNQRGLGRYNLIISNPPYIAHSEYEELEPEVAHWEDPKALLADQEGLVFYPRIANMAMELLHRQPASSSSSQSSTSVTDEGSKDRRTRELDPRTLERIDPLTLEQDEQQRRTDNHNSSNHDPEGEEEEDGVERTWRNGPELDKVKIPELVFEIGGDHQVDSVTAAVRQAGFRRVQVWKDLADRARCIVGAR